MAVGDETIGFGGVAEVNDGAADAFQVIPKVVSLGFPSEVVGTVESKRLDLTDAVIVKLATLKNGDSFSIKIQHTKATYARMETIRKARVAKQWRITIPDDDGGTEKTVPGILTQNKFDPMEAEKINEFEAIIEVSGAEI